MRLFWFLCVFSVWVVLPGRGADPVLFNNVDVVTLDGRGLLRARDVIVVGDRIEAVGPHQPDRDRRGFRVIEGRGKVLSPGLIDMHAHLPRVSEDEAVWRDYFARNLSAGVTTLRSMRGEPGQLSLRARALAGDFVAPRLVLGSPAIGGHRAAADPEALADQFADAGYDFVKILSGFDTDFYRRLTARAAAHALPTAGHLVHGVDPRAALDAAQRSIEHPEGLLKILAEDESTLRTFAQGMRARGVYFCPTLQWYQLRRDLLAGRLPHDSAGLALPAAVAEQWRVFAKKMTDAYGEGADAAEALAKRQQQWDGFARVCRILNEADVRFLVSPGAGPFVLPGRDMLLEMKHLTAFGLSREQALAAATRHAADALGCGDRLGRIEPGYRADLLLLTGNPLERLDVLAQPDSVMAAGRWLRGDLGAVAE